jgi:hypothetical protein
MLHEWKRELERYRAPPFMIPDTLRLRCSGLAAFALRT